MEEIAEGFLRAASSIFRWFVWDLVVQIVLFTIGRFSLLLITFGRYPRGQSIETDAEKISWVGVLVVFLSWGAVVLYNNYV